MRCFTFGMLVYLWSAVFVIGALVGCGDNPLPGEEVPEFEVVQPCTSFEAVTMPWWVTDVVPSMTPADFGVRIIVASDFRPFEGSSYPVPGGRMAWVVWVYHWYDGDRLGAVGRIGDTTDCKWYEPL